MDHRLLAIAEEIGKSKKVLDVGTDHGYLAVYLIEKNLADFAIVSDISKGSLQKATTLIAEKKLGNRIESRLGSGLEVLRQEDMVDHVVIAGMGGNLIASIVLQKKDLLIANNTTLVLQPMQNPEVLRKLLLENEMTIIGERLVKESGKIYQIIKVSPEPSRMEYNRWELEFGKNAFYQSKEQRSLFEKLLQKRIAEIRKIIESIKASDSQDADVLVENYQAEINELIKLLE